MATGAMPKGTVEYRDLRGYLRLLEEAGLLHRITAEVDLKHEIGAICARSLAREGPALLFENVKGYPGMPFVANLLSTLPQLGIVFNVDPDEEKLYERAVYGMDHRMPSVVLEAGPCKEVIVTEDGVDLYRFPTPWWHEHDGGQYLGTTTGVITRDPDTGILNMGSYRTMIKDKSTLTMTGGTHGANSAGGPGGGAHILSNEKAGLPTPVALAMGMDPLLTLASGSPVTPNEHGQMEFEAAGGWRGGPTELVKCETNDLLVPASAEIVIEGEFLPNVRTPEGPHGESWGFYGENKEAFVLKVKCITHRRDPITYGLICQMVEDYPRHIVKAGSFLSRLIEESGMTNIKDAYFPQVGRHGIIIISAQIHDREEPRRIMEAAWETDHYRWVVVVDDDCDVRDWNDVMWRIVSTVEPDRDVIKGKVIPQRLPRKEGGMDFTPPSCGLGIDATMRLKDPQFDSLIVNKVSKELMAKAAARWQELGLS